MSVGPTSTPESVAELLAEIAALKAERERLGVELTATTKQLDATTKQLGTTTKQLGTTTKQLDTTTKQLDTTTKQLDTTTKQVKVVEQRAERLKLQVRRLAYLLFGRRSERLSAEETAQLVLSFGGTDEQATAVDPNVPVPPPGEEVVAPQGKSGKRLKKRKHPGRTQLSPDLERIVTDVAVPEAERACKCCGESMTAITPVEHQQVEHVPEKLVVHVERREVLVCKNSRCRADAVTAERSPTPMVVRRAGVSLYASLIENKCDDALPIHRQRDRLMRLGFDVPLNTLYDYWSHATALLSPVSKTTLSVVLGDDYVNVDDTTLKVLDAKHKKGRFLGHLWCFTGTRKLVAYTFTKNWEAETIAPYIGAIDGFIQCDDYKGYSKQVALEGLPPRTVVPPERRLGCMMHVRRRFHDALKLGDRRATEPIAIIRELYLIEAEAKERGLDASARLALRTARSLPWLTRLETWIDARVKTLLPTSKLGEACSYALQQRPFIRRCFSDGRFEIDNGKVERAIREPALGRRNFLFTGSSDAAQRLADAYTLVQSCRLLGISTRDYLVDVLHKLEHGWPVRRVAELVPDRWAGNRGLLVTSNQAAEQLG
jgi:transposase